MSRERVSLQKGLLEGEKRGRELRVPRIEPLDVGGRGLWTGHAAGTQAGERIPGRKPWGRASVRVIKTRKSLQVGRVGGKQGGAAPAVPWLSWLAAQPARKGS